MGAARDNAYDAADRRLDCAPRALALPTPRIRNEFSSAGIDEYLQLIGGGKGSGITSTGLRIPTAPFALPSGGDIGVGRYLFQLATQKVGVGRRVRVRGARQLVTLGAIESLGGDVPRLYPLEQPVVSPNWRFNDGNIEWSIVLVRPRPRVAAPPTDAANFMFRYSDASACGALLYEDFTVPDAHELPTGAPDFYTYLSSYQPPAFPRADTLSGDLNNFRDLRFLWTSDRAWDSLDVEVEGPCSIVMFASVRQTNPATRAALPNNAVIPNSMPEEQFLQCCAILGTKAIYWRVAGALITEDVR